MNALSALIFIPLAASVDLSESSLQQRPLNAYVPANAVHVKTANRSIIVDGSLIPYAEAFPPFLIKNRGTVTLLTPSPSLLFASRPSLFQMIAAAGHRTIVPYVTPSSLSSFIRQAEMHHVILVCFPSINCAFPSQLEGAVIIDPKENSDLPPPELHTVLLYTSNRTADQGEGPDWKNTRVESIPFSISSLDDSQSEKGREKFGQILANFFDRVHTR
ncbi:hypothetical protein PRIPAC_92181 [Pristionchus pacificus]|uniref:Uncharacterized protein n=1 Tax=Pristionchus pacificus TaxID=54126 RepID=A0A2A6CIQ7_PRIPA|nr:hypothetical protein PRIPAC_92181 [Pristionchus pacificus]|eukprot:PDM77957.1 hypothetical protein PRIPAC_34824 [Pristionchus pacificus]